jgi:hypothetical protein
MFHAETIGLHTVLMRVRECREILGEHWTAAPLLERLVSIRGSVYHDLHS